MSDPSAPDEDTPAARRLAMIERLAEIGMALAEGMLAKATLDDGTVQASPEAMMAFARLSRAVRLTAVLAGRMEAALDAGEAQEQGYSPANPPDAGVVERVRARFRLLTRKEEVRGLAERAIAAEARERFGEVDVERLREALNARMERGEVETDWESRPLGELAAQVCADLGIRYDPGLWATGGGLVPPGREGRDPLPLAGRGQGVGVSAPRGPP